MFYFPDGPAQFAAYNINPALIMKHHIPTATLATLFAVSRLLHAEIPVKTGEKVAFLGDSITEFGQNPNNPGGYVNLIAKGLEANGVKIEIIGAGISGHKSNDMLKRLDNDVLNKKPQWMTLSCGVNDVWHGANGVPLEEYKKNITEIVDKAQAAGVKVVILTSTMIGETQADDNNQKLVAYNEFLRSLATQKKCHLADLNAAMQTAVTAGAEAAKKQPKSAMNNLTIDGVHMAFAGNEMMALGVLEGLGLDKNEITKARTVWLDIPNTVTLTSKVTITQRQAKQLEKLAAQKNTNVDSLLDEQFNRGAQFLLKSAEH